jgi:hypothetical protein
MDKLPDANLLHPENAPVQREAEGSLLQIIIFSFASFASLRLCVFALKSSVCLRDLCGSNKQSISRAMTSGAQTGKIRALNDMSS